MSDNIYKQFEDVYNNVMKKGVTFSKDMGDEIHKELEKMLKQREEWLKRNGEKENIGNKVE